MTSLMSAGMFLGVVLLVFGWLVCVLRLVRVRTLLIQQQTEEHLNQQVQQQQQLNQQVQEQQQLINRYSSSSSLSTLNRYNRIVHIAKWRIQEFYNVS